MKANPSTHWRASGLFPALAGLSLLCSCVGPAPTSVAPPASAPPPPPARPAIDWHDLPATPGVWHWGSAGTPTVTVARFAGPEQRVLFSMVCDRKAGEIALILARAPGPATKMVIRTTSLTRSLAAISGIFGMTATLAARDPLLDAMAFSRGRFAVEVPGLAPLYLPSWPEVSRVIEDCR